MSYAEAPEYCASNDLRCEALVRGKPGWPDWAQRDHRCVKWARTGRNGFAVCPGHNQTETVTRWTGGPDAFPRINRYGRIKND